MLYKLQAFLATLKPCKRSSSSKEGDYFEKKKDVSLSFFFFLIIILMSGTRLLPEALIRSNVSCQIRRLINHGRDQSSPLTDGETEAGHFFSTSLTFSSAFSRKQNKSGLVSALLEHRRSSVFSDGAHTQPAGEAFQRPPPR